LPVEADEPLVCVDERPCELLSPPRPPLPSKVGQPARYDFDYERHGSCTLFMIFQPSAGWPTIKVTAHRKQEDFALLMRELVEVHFPNASHMRLVLDTLNSHSPLPCMPLLKRLRHSVFAKIGF